MTEAANPAWTQRPSNAMDRSVDLGALRARLEKMTDDELVKFGRQVRGLCYPLTYDGDGKPTISAFDVQLEEARREWRRRKAKS
jgi:hypothetical protein